MPKREVKFIGEPVFDKKLFPGHEVAHVRTLDHYVWGQNEVRTSAVVMKYKDGSFETLNTIYKPHKE